MTANAFLAQLEQIPERITAAHEAAGAAIDAVVLPDPSTIRNALIVGVGGSALAGEMVAVSVNDESPIPIHVLRQYRAPAYVGPDTLVFALSGSGDTEETVSMTEAALEQGARVVAVSGPGPLADLVSAGGGTLLSVARTESGRTPVAELVAPVVVALYRLGFAPGGHAMLVRAQEQLARRRETCGLEADPAKNPARELARRIGRSIPLVYGGGAIGRVAAHYWKSELNKSAKIPAFFHSYPEIDHDEVAGWGQHGDVTRQVFTVIELRHGYEHIRVADRFAITREMVREAVLQILTCDAQGEGRLAQMLDLGYVGGITAAYVALDNDVDPGPIDAVDQVKAALAARD